MSIQQIYGSLTSPKQLPSRLHDHQEYLIKNIILNLHLSQFPPSTSYQRSFWKHVLNDIECANEEVDERIYDRYMSLLQTSGAPGRNDFMLKPPEPSFITHFWGCPSSASDDAEQLQNTVTLYENRTTIEGGTTGLRTWRASFMLAEWLLAHQDMVIGKRILELGSGIGFLGILVAQLQRNLIERGEGCELAKSTPSTQQGCPAESPSSYLYMTDVNEDVLDRCLINFNLAPNGLEGYKNVEICKLDWFDSLSNAISQNAARSLLNRMDPGVVIGADVVFDVSLIPALIETLWIALTTESKQIAVGEPREAWIALSVRRERTVEIFVSQAESRGFTVDDIPWNLPPKRTFYGGWEGGTDDAIQEVKLFQLTIANKAK